MPQKIFIIACEPSGDLHGSHLIDELKKTEPDIELRGLGGPKMQASGVQLLHDMTTFSALGLGDVIRQYLTYQKIFYQALEEVRRFQPDALILIDSPAFNLRFAKKIKKKIPVFYYIAPQIWAWGKRRIKTIKKTIHQMIVILPFEEEIYKKAKIPCEFVGHPLLDRVRASAPREKLRDSFEILPGQTAVGLLSGSRESEVRRILPAMLQTARELKPKLADGIFFVTLSSNVQRAVYDRILKDYGDVRIRVAEGRLYDLITAMDFALITSGTTTLEAALLGTPFFLLYKASWSTYALGKRLIRVPYLGLVNLLADTKVVPEFIQQDICPKTIAHEASVFLQNPELYKKMQAEFSEVREKLGEHGASRRAAQTVLNFLRDQK